MMKNITQFSVIVLLCILSTISCFAYDGPTEEGGFFPIGWSPKGNIFAYGYYVGSNLTQDASSMVIRIQNMVTDSILFSHSQTWVMIYTDNTEYAELPTANVAWKQISKIVNKELIRYNIEGGKSSLNKFPPSGDWEFKAEVRPFDMEPGYGLYIKYFFDGREKMVTTYGEELDGKTDNLIWGFVWSPNNKRIAVITTMNLMEEEFNDFQAVGCHMKVGFK